MSEKEDPIVYVASTPVGREFLAQLLAMANLRSNTYANAGARPELDMAYKEGRKSVGYALIAKMVEQCPEYLALLRKEHAQCN